ncbi:unnamed protein product [Angiostrongylus costaricensis]|uniref:Methylase_S domain-containing protein n=1 Tax=Angiostrongylus costaricensis TaxID=334426 RepID=A0A0R3PZL7_ANGCS|nr:unnamed protein product [Angiostrongylus costaricensis]
MIWGPSRHCSAIIEWLPKIPDGRVYISSAGANSNKSPQYVAIDGAMRVPIFDSFVSRVTMGRLECFRILLKAVPRFYDKRLIELAFGRR